MTPRSWTLEIPGALWTVNRERTKHWSYRSKMAAPWRRDAAIMARAAGIPHLDRCTIDIMPAQLRGKLADTGAHEPAAKAILDGIVDAGVLDDDTGAYVLTITSHPPVRATRYDRITIKITEAQ